MTNAEQFAVIRTKNFWTELASRIAKLQADLLADDTSTTGELDTEIQTVQVHIELSGTPLYPETVSVQVGADETTPTTPLVAFVIPTAWVQP